MKTAQEMREKQNEWSRRVAEAKVKGFSDKVEREVEQFSNMGLHQVSVAIPDVLKASAASLGIGYEKLGYRVKIHTEKGYFGTGLFKGSVTFITLGW